MNWQLVQFLKPQLFALLDLSCQGNPCLAFVLVGPRAMNRAFWFPQFTSIGNLWSCLTIDNYVKDLHGGSTWIIFNIKNKLNHIQEVTKFWVNSPSITLAWDVLLRGRLCNFINVIVLVTVGYKSRLVRWREQKGQKSDHASLTVTHRILLKQRWEAGERRLWSTRINKAFV